MINELSNIYQALQTKKYRTVITKPVISDVGERELVLFNGTSSRALYTKLNGVLYNIKFGVTDPDAASSSSSGASSTGALCVSLVITTNSTNTNQLVLTADSIDIMGSVFVGYSTTAAMNIAGAGGIDTGSEGASEWRTIWAIADSAGTQAGVLLSTAFGTSYLPVMPLGFTKWRLLGWVRNDSSSNIVPFRKKGRHVQYWSAINILNAGSNAASWTDIGIENQLSSSAVSVELSVLVGDASAAFGKGARIQLRPKGIGEDATSTNDYLGFWNTDTANGKQAFGHFNLGMGDQRRLQYQQTGGDDSTVDQVIISVISYEEDIP